MKRALMQIYTTHSDQAASLYQEAFGAKLISSYPNEDGTFFHALLQEGAQIIFSLGTCEYSPLMVDLIDRFGVRWCLFV